MKVLIVEDDTLERRALVKLFSISFPTKFTTVKDAMDGRSGLKALREDEYDLAILDINLPDMTGLEILEIINRDYPDTKVIMATAYSDYSHIRDSMRSNAFDYLLKPYSIKTFEEAINRFISYREQSDYGEKGTVGKVKSYIEANVMRDFSLDELASECGYEKSYLGRIFKKNENKSIMSYALEYKMDKAEELLKKGKSVGETAAALGFLDPSYFSKCFKRVKNYSPKDKKR